MIEQINGTTFGLRLGDDLVEIGNKDASKFEPHIYLPRWNGECFLTIKPSGEITEVEVEVEGDKVKSKYKVKQGEYELELESEFYTLQSGEQYELGALEFNTILNERPPTNRLVFNFEAQGLVLYHQPPLTQEEIDEGAFRPDNVVNSIAVYHATKSNHAIGQTNYMCGKAYHLFRGQAIDSNGWQVWVDKFLDLDRREIVYLIPYDFWLNARYPVRHALGDTFGYTNTGATTISSANRIRAYMATGAAGTGTSMSFYSLIQAANNYQLALYKESDNSFVMGTNEGTDLDVLTWYTQNFTSNPTLTAINYYCCVLVNSANIKADNNGQTKNYQSQTYENGWPSPLNLTTGTSRHYSIYCTYTPGDGVQTVVPISIASAEAFGNPTITVGAVTVQPISIASAEAFGNPSIVPTYTIEADSIASAEAFGSPAVLPGTATIEPISIGSAEAFGNPLIALEVQTVQVISIDSSEAFGSPAVNATYTVQVISIGSSEAFGNPAVTTTYTVQVISIGSAEAFGNPALLLKLQFIKADSIASVEAFGYPNIWQRITLPPQYRDIADATTWRTIQDATTRRTLVSTGKWRSIV